MRKRKLDVPVLGIPELDLRPSLSGFDLARRTVYATSFERYVEETAMGILRSFDRRNESRIPAELSVMVWGVHTCGERCLQEARARDISLSGAMLSGLDTDLRSGDLVGILCGKRKARFRVVWVRYDDTGDKMLVAVQRIAADACPWEELLTERAESSSPELQPPSP